jgi:hypothetical protein
MAVLGDKEARWISRRWAQRGALRRRSGIRREQLEGIPWTRAVEERAARRVSTNDVCHIWNAAVLEDIYRTVFMHLPLLLGSLPHSFLSLSLCIAFSSFDLLLSRPRPIFRLSPPRLFRYYHILFFINGQQTSCRQSPSDYPPEGQSMSALQVCLPACLACQPLFSSLFSPFLTASPENGRWYVHPPQHGCATLF